MSRLKPEKLKTRFLPGTTPTFPVIPRRYTLTHSDRTGHLFLTIGGEYHLKQIRGWYTRLMRDEILAEWRHENTDTSLHVYCHVSGGFVMGTAKWRNNILKRELPLALECIRHGERRFFRAHPQLDEAAIHVHFQSSKPKFRRVEDWGTPSRYALVTVE